MTSSNRPVIKARKTINVDTVPHSSPREAFFQIVHRPANNQPSSSSSYDEDQHGTVNSPVISNGSPAPPVTPRKLLPSSSFPNEIPSWATTNGITNPFIVRSESSRGARDSLESTSTMFLVAPHPSRVASGRTLASSSDNLDHYYEDDSSLLRGIFSYEGKTVDLEMSDNTIKWKRTNTGMIVLPAI